MHSMYISVLMTYIELEYDDIPSCVTEEMYSYFEECWLETPPMCLPNAAGGFWERFIRSPETL